MYTQRKDQETLLNMPYWMNLPLLLTIQKLEADVLLWLDKLVAGVLGVPQQMAHDSGPDPQRFHILVLRRWVLLWTLPPLYGFESHYSM